MSEDWQEQLAKFGGIKWEEEKKPQKNFPKDKGKKNPPPKKSTPVKHFTPSKIATAPYNFVSLPEKVLPSEIESVDAFKSHIEKLGKISGEIVLEIEALTPLFFGGNGESSFAPAGTPIISGSSLRGMFKNIFKIVTCGTFRGSTNSQQKGEDFNDEHIYFRCLMGTPYAWMKDLNKYYKLRMEGEKGKNARPGFLIQTFDNKYFIAPLRPNIERKNDFIMIKDFQEKFGAVKFIDSRVKWNGEIAYILTGNQWANRPEKLLTREKYEEYRESLKGLTAEEIAKKNEELNYGKQIIRFVKLSYIDWSKRIELPDEVLKSYEHDRNRRSVNLINYKKINPRDQNEGILSRSQLEKLCPNLLDDIKTLIPCHFLYEGGQVTAFGHGQCFRIPYKNSIGNLVPLNLQAEETIDFADAVFGLKENWASRVAFEDTTSISEIETLETATAHPLMQPNPTSYQLYLKQEGANLNHWEKDSMKIRGYKLYWHNKIWNWKANDAEIKLDAGKPLEKRSTKKLTPLKKGSKFKAKIRFQNLSEIELGALMMIFNLNGAKNPAYKIGMGKSLGLGSIKVNPTLFIESDDAYTTLFDGDKFKNPYEKVDAAKYLDAFKKYINRQGMLQTWEKIMKELNTILNWENVEQKNWIQKVEQMQGEYRNNRIELSEKFKERLILPDIFEVVK